MTSLPQFKLFSLGDNPLSDSQLAQAAAEAFTRDNEAVKRMVKALRGLSDDEIRGLTSEMLAQKLLVAALDTKALRVRGGAQFYNDETERLKESAFAGKEKHGRGVFVGNAESDTRWLYGLCGSEFRIYYAEKIFRDVDGFLRDCRIAGELKGDLLFASTKGDGTPDAAHVLELMGLAAKVDAVGLAECKYEPGSGYATRVLGGFLRSSGAASAFRFVNELPFVMMQREPMRKLCREITIASEVEKQALFARLESEWKERAAARFFGVGGTLRSHMANVVGGVKQALGEYGSGIREIGDQPAEGAAPLTSNELEEVVSLNAGLMNRLRQHDTMNGLVERVLKMSFGGDNLNQYAQALAGVMGASVTPIGASYGFTSSAPDVVTNVKNTLEAFGVYSEISREGCTVPCDELQKMFRRVVKGELSTHLESRRPQNTRNWAKFIAVDANQLAEAVLG